MKQKSVILSQYVKSEKTIPLLFNVIVTKYSSCRARYSHMLSESYATVHFTYTRELCTILIKSFLVYFI